MTDASVAGTPDGSGQTGAKSKRWLKGVLVGSLALNVLFIGMAASAFWRFGGPSAFNQNVPGNLVAYVDTLPRGRERVLIPNGKDVRQTLLPLRRELREARRELLTTMAAEQFDRSAYERAQAKLFNAEFRLRGEQGTLLANVAANLTPEERRAYIRWHDHRRLQRRQAVGPDDENPPAPVPK